LTTKKSSKKKNPSQQSKATKSSAPKKSGKAKESPLKSETQTQTFAKSEVGTLPPVESVTPSVQDKETLAMQEASQITQTPAESSKLVKEKSNTKPKEGRRSLGLFPSDLGKLSKSEIASIDLKASSISEFLNGVLIPYDDKAISPDTKKNISTLAATNFSDVKSSTISAQLYRAIQFRTLSGLRTFEADKKTTTAKESKPEFTPQSETTAIVPVDQAPSSITQNASSETQATA
jgi:hypothetical protein